MKFLGSVYAIDPGSEKSGYVRIEDEEPKEYGTIRNIDLLSLKSERWQIGAPIVIEQVTPWGKLNFPTRDTLVWIGRFYEACWRDFKVILLPRDKIKMHLLGQTKGSDADIKNAMEQRFGPAGTKKNPNRIIYGIKGDEWQALAAGVSWIEMEKLKQAGLISTGDLMLGSTV